MLALRLDKTHAIILEDAESGEKLAQIIINSRSPLHYVDLVADAKKSRVRIEIKEIGRKIEKIGDSNGI